MTAIKISIFRARMAEMIGHMGVVLISAGILRGLFEYQPSELWSLAVVILGGGICMCISARWGKS